MITQEEKAKGAVLAIRMAIEEGVLDNLILHMATDKTFLECLPLIKGELSEDENGLFLEAVNQIVWPAFFANKAKELASQIAKLNQEGKAIEGAKAFETTVSFMMEKLANPKAKKNLNLRKSTRDVLERLAEKTGWSESEVVERAIKRFDTPTLGQSLVMWKGDHAGLMEKRMREEFLSKLPAGSDFVLVLSDNPEQQISPNSVEVKAEEGSGPT